MCNPSFLSGGQTTTKLLFARALSNGARFGWLFLMKTPQRLTRVGWRSFANHEGIGLMKVETMFDRYS